MESHPVCLGLGLCIIRIVIQITVNGTAHRFERPIDVSGLLKELALVGKKVAVERNGEIVPRSAHGNTQITDGDQLEIVVAVGGG
jgi:sulfur carrier protein